MFETWSLKQLLVRLSKNLELKLPCAIAVAPMSVIQMKRNAQDAPLFMMAEASAVRNNPHYLLAVTLG
jgi:hypothetical protein